MRDSKELMDICREGLPDHTDEYLPDIVHDFIWDYWDELKELINNDKL